jgi:predicted O-methyltransferase YrrM
MWRAKTRHGVHSPFVYELIDKVIYDRIDRPAYARVKAYRSELEKDTSLVQITDLGAGSLIDPHKSRTVAQLARGSAKQPRYGELLHRLVAHFRPANMVELGTSLGVSALYQATGNENGRLITIEGCPNTAAKAAEYLQNAGTGNIIQHTGPFDDVLPDILSAIGRLDWAFVDGNHRSEPTLRYFEWFLEHAHPGTILVFDDIYWTPDMTQAWENIKAHPKVSVTIDLFQIGIVSFRSGQAKEHFTVRY